MDDFRDAPSPCPFCGWAEPVYRRNGADCVYCPNCDAEGPTGPLASKWDAPHNRIAALEAEVDALRDQCNALRAERDAPPAASEAVRERVARINEVRPQDAKPEGKDAP